MQVSMRATQGKANTGKTPNLVWLCFCAFLAFAQTSGAFFSNMAIQSLNASLPDDVELLCTGSEMKFVSLSQSFAAGEMVFVSAPADTTEIAEYWCQQGVALLDEPEELSIQHAEFATLSQQLSQATQLISAQFVVPLSPAQPRAPPVFSIVV